MSIGWERANQIRRIAIPKASDLPFSLDLEQYQDLKK